MQGSSAMLFKQTWMCHMDGIFLLMQAFHIVRNYWFHIEVFNIRNGEKLTCGNVKFLCHCHSKLILHVYVGQRINKNFLTCIMHKPAMLSSIFLVSSSTSSVSFWEHRNIIMQFRPRFLLLFAPFIISFVCMILMTRQRMTMKWWINKLMLEICLCIKKVGVNMPKMMLL